VPDSQEYQEYEGSGGYIPGGENYWPTVKREREQEAGIIDQQ